MQNLSNFNSQSKSQLYAFNQQNPLSYLSFQYTEDDLHSFNDDASVYKIEKRYRILKQIRGGFNPTFTAIDQEYGQKVSIKVIKIEKYDLIYINQLIRQIKIENHFQHENIYYNLHIMIESKILYIVREFIVTDLERVIYSLQELNNDHIQCFTYQILRALFFLHSQNVYHYVMRPNNILLNQNFDLKISGFLGTKFPNDFDKKYSNTNRYQSPYYILGLPEDLSKTYIWNVGVIILELIQRINIFTAEYCSSVVGGLLTNYFYYIGSPSKEDLDLLLEKGYKYQYNQLQSLPTYRKQPWQVVFPRANPLLCDLLDKMLVFNEDKRYTVKECLQHPYFEDIYDQEDIYECNVKFDHSQFQTGLNENEVMKDIYFEVEKSYQKQQLKRYQIQIIQNIAFQKHLSDQIPLNPKLIFYNLYEDL